MLIIETIQSLARERRISPAIFAVVLGMSGASAANAADTLSANDVSWLFPAPAGTGDLANLISIDELKGSDGNPLVSDAVFDQYVENAESNASEIEQGLRKFRIGLPLEAKEKKNWRIASLRIDPAAPGTSEDIIAHYGRTPQLRLVVQPIDNSGQPFDIAGHFVFNITLATKDPAAQEGCLPRNKADDDAFKKIVSDFADLKKKLAEGDFGEKIETGGPLGVHPGLASGKTKKALRDALKGVLENNLSGQRLNSMAIMGLEGPEPWIFLATFKSPLDGKFTPAPGVMLDGIHAAEMLSKRSGTLEIFPKPVTNNLNQITCRNGATPSLPLEPKDRNGVSTAQLFGSGALTGQPARDVVERIANTSQSHFFNTDCVSCHTETRRPMSVLGVTSFNGIDPEVLPQDDWNVRNFGWFTSFL
ncbi:MAG: hypothetical protein ACT4O2_08670, partial [Beijerinckiaceae bacterium]